MPVEADDVGDQDARGRRLDVGAGAHRSTPAPLRDRLTMAEAIRLIDQGDDEEDEAEQQQDLGAEVPARAEVGWR